jgi:Domain of unknown function (DUF929)
MAKASSGSGRDKRPVRPTQTGASAPKNQSNQSNQSGQPRQPRQPGQPRPAAARRTAPPPASGIALFRRRHPVMAALVPVGLVVLALVALVVVKATGGSSAAPPASKVSAGSGSSATSAGTSALPAGVLTDVTSVSATTLAAIGEPSATVAPTSTGAKTTLTAANGKPEILFIGAEYCPFCAAERWSVVEALSRFGTFSGLSATHSSTTDVYPDTQTFSFYGATYTGTSLDFTSVELETNQASGDSYTTLQTPTAAQEALLSKYDKAPYTTQPGSIPFLDIGNKEISVGAGFTPQVLQGLSMTQIAAQLNDKNSAVATAIDGEANRIVAAITAATGVQPDSASASASPTPATTSTPTTAAGS